MTPIAIHGITRHYILSHFKILITNHGRLWQTLPVLLMWMPLASPLFNLISCFTGMLDFSGPGLSNFKGHALARQLLCPCLPHDLHDYIFKGICKVWMECTHFLLCKQVVGKQGYSMAIYCFYIHWKSLTLHVLFLNENFHKILLLLLCIPPRVLRKRWWAPHTLSWLVFMEMVEKDLQEPWNFGSCHKWRHSCSCLCL